MELLQRADFDDLSHNLSARRMLLRIYFEKNERDALSSLITSFKNFIYRHRELGTVPRNGYLNLLKFVNRLLSVDHYDKEAVAQLRDEISRPSNWWRRNGCWKWWGGFRFQGVSGGVSGFKGFRGGQVSGGAGGEPA
ncbi:MAG: hypothetical protein IPN76_19125 [Saprospiraceae bacterium]|nr:hypothetical protein [Saprospiraceae bacterium]